MPEKILIVDDEATTAELLRRLLELDGFATLVTEPRALIATLEAERPTLVIIDFHLTDANGVDLLKDIRAKSTIVATPVLMMSALDRREECTQAGANAFLLKPFNRDELLQAMEETWQAAGGHSKYEAKCVKQQE